MKLFKKLLSIIISILFIFCINVSSKTLYNDGYKQINNYIKNFHNYQRFIVTDSQKYGFKNKQLYDDSNLKYGGLINKEEFDISKKSNSTYLFNGLEYFTMTKDGSNKIFVVTPTDANHIESKPLIEPNNLRITNYIQADVKLTGQGKINDPWRFIDKYQVEFIYNDNEVEITPNILVVPENGIAKVELIPNSKYIYDSNDCNAEYFEYKNEITNNITRELRINGVNKDIKCNVKMLYNIRNVTLLSNGGTIEQKAGWTLYEGKTEKEFTYGEKIGVLPKVDWGIGYHLSGYFADGQRIEEDTIVRDNLTITPQKELNEYMLTYDSNGGTNCDPIKKTYGSTWGTLCTPSRDRYQFVGWFTKKIDGTQITENTTVTNNIIVYARWESNKLYIQYNGNGGTWGVTSQNSSMSVDKNGFVIYTASNSKNIQTIDVNANENVKLMQYNGEWINFKRIGYKIISDKAWGIMDSNGTITTSFSLDNDIKTSDLIDAIKCNIDIGSCTIKLYLNWDENHLFVLYNGNNGTWNDSGLRDYPDGGRGIYTANPTSDLSDGYVRYINENQYHTNNDIVYDYYSLGDYVKTVQHQGAWYNFIRNGYSVDEGVELYIKNNDTGKTTTLKEWCNSDKESPDCTDYTAEAISEWGGCNLEETDCTVTFYVNWAPHTLNIQYNGNKGAWIANSNSIYHVDNENFVITSSGSRYIHVELDNSAHDKTVNLLYPQGNGEKIKFERNGYNVPSGKEWGIKNSNGNIIKTFPQQTPIKLIDITEAVGCDLSKKDCTITLYVNWKANTSQSTLACELKLVGYDKNAYVTWRTYPPTGANAYQIDALPDTPSTYNMNETLRAYNKPIYGHVISSSNEVKTCRINVQLVCGGPSPYITYHGSCYCTQYSWGGNTSSTISLSNTGFSNCTAYCRATQSNRPNGHGQLFANTVKSCSGNYNVNQCPSPGCYNDTRGYCQYYPPLTQENCPSNYTHKNYVTY